MSHERQPAEAWTTRSVEEFINAQTEFAFRASLLELMGGLVCQLAELNDQLDTGVRTYPT